MAFGNYQNESKKRKSTNTKGIQFFNKSISHSTIIVGHWDTAITLKIHPCLPSNKMTETNVYDYESFVSSVLSINKAYDLLMGAKSFKMQLDAGMSPESVGVASGSGFVQISHLATEEFTGVQLTIYSDIGQDGKPTQELSYAFNKSNYFKNYSAENGSYDKSDYYEAEFERFVILLEETIKASTGALAHSVRHADMYTRDSMLNSLSALKEKMGIQSTQYNGTGRNNATTFFNSTHSSTNDDDTPTFGSIENGGTVSDRLPI